MKVLCFYMKKIFISISIPDEVKVAIQQTMTQISGTISDFEFKWQDTKKMHITLLFVGNVSDHKVSKIASTLEKLVDNTDPFEIEIFGLSAFPHIMKPKVVWLGCRKGRKQLLSLNSSLAGDLKGMIRDEYKKFNPHLTLSYLKEPLDGQLLMDLEIKKVASFTVSKVEVMESSVQSGTVYHQPLYSFSL